MSRPTGGSRCGLIVLIAWTLVIFAPIDDQARADLAGHESTGRFPHSIAVADFNGDRHLDLAIAASAERKVTVLLGDGKGGVIRNTSYSVGRGPTWVTAGDLDGDGHPDLATADTGAMGVTVLFNDGRGNFSRQQTVKGLKAPVSAVIREHTRNGLKDLAVLDTLMSQLVLFQGMGGGALRQVGTYPVGKSPHILAEVDLNRDRLPDLIATSLGQHTITV
ncbi:MAG: FG-GAP repeat domain-containing protein, partial [Candidatus Methylomirabilales bacterium]